MSLRRMFAGAAVAAAVASAGLMAAPAAQAAAAPTVTAAPAPAVGPTAWIPWGWYSSLGACAHAGQWAVMNAGASYYLCPQVAPDRWDLILWRP
ncbi:hypothetical protein [Streptomyces clavuligerus]|uniref:Secreted protein n=1 Tax=Streptomyces clavuligerus TaxID=1901 RepID=B5GYS0_STRCL|nr:hypothetical protein [Streptomyces clavuligerus]ANW22581.1 hypothetical protein BB341_30205 [Streptomyces clavuligerus]AXU17467.1 hypothetical protein D1794_33365 [Streptomyces clavuligerus]EDY51466.1 hypothetical protein SSCG_04671 [Streptomyces clavuligerus]EFG04714.1 Hypothetical protein SCLAV_p1228 [Streptomyces clavuligerus]MBY6306840.1 hypothetical protein [Streptomyces clavuligerus]